MKKSLFSVILFVIFISAPFAQQKDGYIFTIKKEMPCTPVRNQSSTSTCWCFSGISMLESELLRTGRKPADISEMFVVRLAYEKKADMHVRMHGSSNFAGGGEYGDVLTICREYGLVPESVYPGLNYGDKNHNHGELDAVLKGYVQKLTERSRLSTAWMNGFRGILDAYLGKVPQSFTWEGRTYTPASYMKEIGINPDDYITFTSFTHHPFYEKFALEVPDNWAAGLFYNLPLAEMMQVISYALENGYTVAWASDVSDRGFSQKEGVAVVPEKDWGEMTAEEAENVFKTPVKQKEITQEMRQKEFDNYSTTDDHGMHIVGIATDQMGNEYYKVKNSWGETGKYKGFIYVSKPFVALRTTNCMVNKNGVPPEIAGKLGLK
ncbi:MAG: aminopeptidase [Bacteroidales bacterium]|nr:aminopeptidase [Bacteroidales bacterium]